MVKKLLSLLIVGIVSMFTSCSSGQVANKTINNEEKNEVIRELESLGYIDKKDKEAKEKKEVRKELHSLGYLK